MTALLEIRALCKSYGGLKVTRDVSLALEPGARVALIGPNGAGKSTLVNQISGVIRPDSGEVLIRGTVVTDKSQAYRVRHGLSRTFQLTTLAPHFPVQRQVELALFEREGLTGQVWRNIDDYPVIRAEAREMLKRFGLESHAGKPTEDLAYGQQRLLEMALAFSLRPEILLLDEPMAGVPKSEGAQLLAAIAALPKTIAVLLIEHDMDLVFRFATRILVLAEGAVLADGTPEAIRADTRVRAAYLGGA